MAHTRNLHSPIALPDGITDAGRKVKAFVRWEKRLAELRRSVSLLAVISGVSAVLLCIAHRYFVEMTADSTVAPMIGNAFRIMIRTALLSLLVSTGIIVAENLVAKRLAAFDDLRTVGPLLEILDVSVGTTRRRTIIALTRLLSWIGLADVDLLTGAQREQLYGLLLAYYRKGARDAGVSAHAYEQFILAILQAIERIGDKRALRALLLLTGSPKTEVSPYVQEEARICLVGLRNRLAKEQVSQVHLRAAAAPEAAVATLLRPGHSGSDMPEALLRPGKPAEGL